MTEKTPIGGRAAVEKTLEQGVDKIDTERVSIDRRWEFEPDYTIEDVDYRPLLDEHSYDNEPHILMLDDGTFYLTWRGGSSHASNDGKLLQRRANLPNGERLTDVSSETIFDDPDYDTRNQSLGQIGDRLVMWYRTLDAADNTHIDAYSAYSDDYGETWSSSTSIQSLFNSSAVVPWIGDGVQTSNGLMMGAANSDEQIEVVFTNDGETWSDRTTIYDNANATNKLTEPCPLALSEDHILLYGRVHGGNLPTSANWVMESTDGGLSWSSPQFFEIGADQSPVIVEKTRGGEVVAVWNHRKGEEVYAGSIPASVIEEDPAALARIGGSKIDDTHQGYPSIATTGPTGDGVIAAWYSGSNIYLSSLPGSLPSARRQGSAGRFTLSSGQSVSTTESWVRVNYDTESAFSNLVTLDTSNNEVQFDEVGMYYVEGKARFESVTDGTQVQTAIDVDNGSFWVDIARTEDGGPGNFTLEASGVVSAWPGRTVNHQVWVGESTTLSSQSFWTNMHVYKVG